MKKVPVAGMKVNITSAPTVHGVSEMKTDPIVFPFPTPVKPLVDAHQ